jgi:hypothetical protein
MSASNTKKILRVPLSLTAKSADELTRKCLENNIKYNTEFEYFQINKVGNEWVAWFYADVSKFPFIRKETK